MATPRSRVPEHLRTDPPEELLRSLGPELQEAVFIAGNGEFFWPHPVAEEAARWLRGRNLAIIGGEVYEPRAPAWGSFVRQWTTRPDRMPGEEWTSYMERGLRQALREIAQELAGQPVSAPPTERHYFFATRAEDADC